MKRVFLGLFCTVMAVVGMGCQDPYDLLPFDKTIYLSSIPGVVEPVLGATPVTTAINTPQYTGTITWSPSASTFAAGTVYTANIVLTAKRGWTLSGVAANSFTVAGATATNAVNSGTVTAVFPATTATPASAVTQLSIAGVTAPVTGATPVTTITETTQYTGSITWSPSASTFAASTVYTATISLSPKAGYTVAGVAANSFTVAGAAATNAINSGTVTAVFPVTGAPAATAVNILSIAGVTAPVLGATPVTTITETTQYTGTITWSPSASTFAASTAYTATISLSPKAGYTVAGVAANSFTVAGATATNAINSGTVTAVFPATGAAPATAVTLFSIPGVTAPVLGATPVTTAINTAQYTGTITWSPSASTFAANTVYTANLVLTAKTGRTFSGVAANSLTVAGAAATNAANSGTVAAVFPATDSTISLLAISGVTAPAVGAVPITTITDTSQYTGTVVWSGTPSTFAASTSYTATISLSPKAGYAVTGISANSFTVAGAAATNAVNTGTVVAVFPATPFALTMKLVPAGKYQRSLLATEIGTITTAFNISQTEITRAQFLTIMGTDPSSTSNSTSDTSNPVQKANWYHAIAFCNKLSLKEGYTPVYTVTVDGTPIDWSTLTYSEIPVTDNNANWDAVTANGSANGYRLPTEIEWVWAAMGAPSNGQNGGTNTTGYTKAFAGSDGGNTIGSYAVFGYNTSETGRTTTGTTQPVKSKTANELGLYDMSGNVFEWSWDASTTYRVMKGGSWANTLDRCKVADQLYMQPGRQQINIGFRVIRP